MITLTYLDDRRVWINGLTVRGICRYQTLVTLLTDVGWFWFRLIEYEQATTQPSVARLRPIPRAQAHTELATQLLPLDGWADSANLYPWN
jgi:hypothetical protein